MAWKDEIKKLWTEWVKLAPLEIKHMYIIGRKVLGIVFEEVEQLRGTQRLGASVK